MDEYEDDPFMMRYFEDHEIRELASRLFDEHPDAVRRFMLEADMGMVDLRGREMPQGSFEEVTGPAYAAAMIDSAIHWWNEGLHADIPRPKNLPDSFQKEIDTQVLSKNGLLIQYMAPEDRSHDLLMTAVENNGIVLSFVPGGEQTLDLQVAAYKQNPDTLAYVHDQMKGAVVEAAKEPEVKQMSVEERNKKLLEDLEKVIREKVGSPKPPVADSAPQEIETPKSFLDVDKDNAHLYEPKTEDLAKEEVVNTLAQAPSKPDTTRANDLPLHLNQGELASMRTEFAEDLAKMDALYERRELLEAVSQDGLLLEHVPVDKQFLELQVAAVMQNEKAMAFVPGDDLQDVLREASLRAEAHHYEPTPKPEDPRVDFESANYRETSLMEDVPPAGFDPMQADHLEDFSLIGYERQIYIDFKAVDLDGNEQAFNLSETEVMLMEDSPLKELVSSQIDYFSEHLNAMRSSIDLEKAREEGLDGKPIEAMDISGSQGYQPVASIQLAGEPDPMLIPLNPETLKPAHEEHQHLEGLIALQVKDEGVTPTADMNQAQNKADELQDLLGEPVAIVERGESFELEIGEGDSKKVITAENLVTLNQSLDDEISHERERSEKVDFPREHYGAAYDTPPAEEPEKLEINHPEEVEQEKKKFVSL